MVGQLSADCQLREHRNVGAGIKAQKVGFGDCVDHRAIEARAEELELVGNEVDVVLVCAKNGEVRQARAACGCRICDIELVLNPRVGNGITRIDGDINVRMHSVGICLPDEGNPEMAAGIIIGAGIANNVIDYVFAKNVPSENGPNAIVPFLL